MPGRELWYRASLAWQEILSVTAAAAATGEPGAACSLVVAHNAVNQVCAYSLRCALQWLCRVPDA